MTERVSDLGVADGDRLDGSQIVAAVTAAPFRYADGSTQKFEHDGTTEYVEHGRATSGQWHVDENGHFCSFWPPSYRATYVIQWRVDQGRVVGLRFTGIAGADAFEGRYTAR